MNETRKLIAETSERLFRDSITKEVLDRAEQNIWPADLWSDVEGLGLTLAMVRVPGEERPSYGDAGTIVRMAAKYAAPIPISETLLASWVISSAGLPLTGGPLSIAPVTQTHNLTLNQTAKGWVLNGSVHGVPWGRHAKKIALIIDETDNTHITCIEPDLAQLEENANLAGEPRDTITFVSTQLPHDSVVRSSINGERFFRVGSLMRAAQMAGALERVLELTAQYALDRVQFGRPIAKFQSIQHQLAILGSEVAAAGVAVDKALAAADTSEAKFAIAAAKARTGEAVGKATAIAHQVHGAIGFTHEHILHHSTRRLWSWRDEFGRESDWATQVGQDIAASGADNLWSTLTSN